MHYCPYCGTKVKEDEHFCIKCGKEIPDIEARTEPGKPNKWWVLPLITLGIVALVTGGFTYYLNHQSAKAMELYTEAEQKLVEEEYKDANTLLQQALDYRGDFTQAQTALHYTSEALEVEKELEKAQELVDDKEYGASLELIHQAESRLNNYHGSLVSTLVEKIDASQADVRLGELQSKIENGPSINEVRLLIWEAEEINHPESVDIAANLRNQLVDYTFSKASEALNEKQFNDALLITEDGLKYAPDSEKLQSLLTNINKEKSSFETAAKERMEQAMNTALEEHQKNENDAIELISVDVKNDDEGRIVINGEVKSIATVPINSILVEYALIRNGKEIETNEIYIFPDVLYPTEHGKFEFTHFNLKEKSSNIKAEVNKITWYTE